MTIRCSLAIGVVMAAISGCRPSEAQPSRSPNVLLIVVDALRADKLGCYGSTLGATPHFDALAQEGVVFQKAYSHAPWTLPSFASLLTSLAPPQHQAGGQLPQFTPLAPAACAVAECFQDAGYATGEVVNVDFLTKPFGMTRGFTDVDFEVYLNNAQKRDATRTTDAAAAWIRKQRDKPFFLMVHYFDLHLIYSPPAEYRQRFAEPRDRDNANWIFGSRPQMTTFRRGLTKFDEVTIRRAEKLYNGVVAYADAEVGRLLAELNTLGLRDDTIVVLTADHGEEFFDHGNFEHGHTLYDELLHVPLVIAWPGKLSPAVVPSTASLIDVAPTLCALAKVKPAPTFSGHSLFREDKEPMNQPHPVLFEGNFWGPPIVGWMDEGYKLIVTPRHTLLFNLEVDPGERHDLSDAEPQRMRRMSAGLEEARRRKSPS